ncbi:MAG: SLBB domain-containing protein, partial [Phaeodactylibacter sp.]|nr:SLBB domain-containing protein [Phaeodactylibacter sp.]
SVEYPGKYELSAGMQLSDLLDQGVLAEEARRDIAYIYRTKADETVRLLRVDLATVLANPGDASNITLEPKDKLQILNLISFVDKATISSQGALRAPVTISYDPEENVRVSDLILLSNGLAQNAAEFAYIKRTDPTNTKNIDFIRVNLFNVIADTTSMDNRILKPNDQLVVYTKEEFVDQANLVVTGAVRAPGEFEFDDGLRVTDLVYFSGGLKPEATDFAYINRLDLETQETVYIRVDLQAAMNNPGSAENVLMRPFDKLNVMSQTTFIDQTNVDVNGSVRVPGSYPYHPTLTLKDALTMAGGLKFGAASNRVEVSRVIIRNNQPTQTTVAIVEVDDNLNVISGGSGNNFQLQPYDEIIVRNVPDFELQKNVTFEGEVRYP